MTNSYIGHNEFVLANDALREYDGIKEEIRKLKTSYLGQNGTRQFIKYFIAFFEVYNEHCGLLRQKTERLMPLSKSTVFGSIKSRFTKGQKEDTGYYFNFCSYRKNYR